MPCFKAGSTESTCPNSCQSYCSDPSEWRRLSRGWLRDGELCRGWFGVDSDTPSFGQEDFQAVDKLWTLWLDLAQHLGQNQGPDAQRPVQAGTRQDVGENQGPDVQCPVHAKLKQEVVGLAQSKLKDFLNFRIDSHLCPMARAGQAEEEKHQSESNSCLSRVCASHAIAAISLSVADTWRNGCSKEQKYKRCAWLWTPYCDNKLRVDYLCDNLVQGLKALEGYAFMPDDSYLSILVILEQTLAVTTMRMCFLETEGAIGVLIDWIPSSSSFWEEEENKRDL